MDSIRTNLLNTLMEQSDVDLKHMAMKEEFDFYHLVSTGDREGLEKRGFSLMDEGLGKLSPDPARNLLYHFIVSISLITRVCIERGMASETAYTLSDLYIQQVDLLQTPGEINLLHRKMVYDYLERMQKLKRSGVFSRHVKRAMEYINDHLHEAVSANDIADKLGMNKSYLCSLFKKETGFTIGTYIEARKNEMAMDYLVNTNISLIDIANSLGYSSYSYFVQIFKKHTGITPSAYRKKMYNVAFA
ncbi:MAG: AraC family transcriptional regulator [Eubacterium sp.]|nr:AraC family transcriptional regulator [Eubacterium sp.]